jgi:hypothetical protein
MTFRLSNRVFVVPVHWLPAFITIQAGLLASTVTKGQHLLLEHVLGCASIAHLLRLELIRLERTFDGGLNRPIWIILGPFMI